MRYRDRVEAGRVLAEHLRSIAEEPVVVLGLPRGGVPVAAEIATALGAPLDIAVVRKLGAPFQPELGIGAIGEENVMVVNRDLAAALGISSEEIDRVARIEAAELARRVVSFRRDRPPLGLTGKTALIVDDGLATGYTARAAIEIGRRRGAIRVIVAVPVGAQPTVRELERIADRVVCPYQPRFLGAVGQWYEDFAQTSDQEVTALLES